MQTITVPNIEVKTPNLDTMDSEVFIKRALGKVKTVHHLSRNTINKTKKGHEYEGGKASLFFRAAQDAFNHHLPFSLNPDLVWFLITSEIAIHVKDNADEYACWFTDKPAEKQIIHVHDDSLVYGSSHNNWSWSIGLFLEELKKHIAEPVMRTFVSTFSTSNLESRTATIVTFMDVVSKYYEYRMTTKCGIPSFRLEGVREDWILLKRDVGRVAEMFPPMSGYFKALAPVLQEFILAFESGPDLDFWRSFYKQNSGSGNDTISGWITAFIAHTPDRGGTFKLRTNFDYKAYYGVSPTDFPSHVNKADLIWDYHRTEIPMSFISGIFGVDFDDGFVSPRLGYGVVETFADAEFKKKQEVQRKMLIEKMPEYLKKHYEKNPDALDLDEHDEVV